MNKKVIVTGATGFVGSNLCRKLINKGYKVSIIARSTSDFSNIEDCIDKIDVFLYDGDLNTLVNFFRREQAEVVFHLASLFIAEHQTDQVDSLIESNIKFGLHVLEAMKYSNTRLMINTGTSWQNYNSTEYNPVCLYAATKEAFISLLKYYIDAEKYRAITLKLFDTYGENDKRPKLINLLNKFAEEQKELDMSYGQQEIDLVHVEDVTNAFIVAYKNLTDRNDKNYQEYGVCSGNPIKLIDLIALFESVSGKTLNINWGKREYRKREVMKVYKGYKTLDNWNCDISLEDGLKKLLTSSSSIY